MASRNRQFDRADFAARPIYASLPAQDGPATAEDPSSQPIEEASNAPFRGDALVAADFLRSLKWSTRAIEMLFDGPERSSIHEITARETAGQVPTRGLTANTGGQGIIVDLVWEAIHGNPARLLAAARESVLLPKSLQVYFVAAIDVGFLGLPGLGTWFTAAVERARAKGKDPATVFAAAREEVRVAGLPRALARSIFSLALVGSAIQEVTASEGIPLPLRQIRATVPAREGRDAIRGLTLSREPQESTVPLIARLRLFVRNNRLAAGLPAVPRGQEFRLWVSLQAFQQAAAKFRGSKKQ